MCAMFKVFIAFISHCRMRAKLAPFKSVATCHLWLSKFKLTEIKIQVLMCTHFKCSRPPCDS